MLSAHISRAMLRKSLAANALPLLQFNGLNISGRFMSTNNGIPKNQIPVGQEDLYVLKSDAKVDSFGNDASSSFPAPDSFSSTQFAGLEAAGQSDALANTVAAAAAAVPTHDIAALGMKPYSVFMQTLERIHIDLGVPYWESIVVAALGIRLVLMPLALNSIRTGQRMVKMQPDLAALNAEFLGPEGAVPKDRAQEYAQAYGALAQKHQVNPVRAFLLPLFQIPVSICAFMGIREMHNYFPGYTSGGTMWFQDLAAADTTYILPVLNSLSFLVIVEMGRFNQQAATTQAEHQKQGLIRNVMRFLGVAMVPITASMPSVS
jgi:membrane protein insertase Oxa1/YidC/SpoIIIJ